MNPHNFLKIALAKYSSGFGIMTDCSVPHVCLEGRVTVQLASLSPTVICTRVSKKPLSPQLSLFFVLPLLSASVALLTWQESFGIRSHLDKVSKSLMKTLRHNKMIETSSKHWQTGALQFRLITKLKDLGFNTSLCMSHPPSYLTLVHPRAPF